MTKEETISNLKAYLDGDTAIGNIIPLRSVLESAIRCLETSLPSDPDEAAKEYLKQYNESEFGNGGDDWEDDIKRTFIAGAEWRDQQIPKLPDNLDEAAEEYAEEFGKYLYGISTAFKAGAEWMAGQGVTKEITIGIATEKIIISVSEQTLNELDLCPGDKVIVQIRKA